MASWVDQKQRLNYLRIYAYTAPDELVPERPLILRISVNKGADILTIAKRGRDYQGLNRSWYFELSLLPEEILDFLPWVVSLVIASDKGSAVVVSDPPHPFDFRTANALSFHHAWTHQASSRLAQQLIPMKGYAPHLTTL